MLIATPEPPRRGSGSNSTIKDRIRTQLATLAPANAEEIAGALDIKVNTTTKILSNLYRAGEVEPVPKKRKSDPARWRLVPPERQAEVASAAISQVRRNLFATIKNLPIPLQGAIADQILAASTGTVSADELLAEKCPGIMHAGPCTCPTANIYVQRHRRRSDAAKRTRREATRRRQELKKLNEEHKRVLKEEPPRIQFLTDKSFAREAIHLLAHLAARVEDETKQRHETGIGDLSNADWGELRKLCDEMKGGVVHLYKAFGVLLDDRGDWLDGTALDEFGYEEGAIGVAELLAGIGEDSRDIWDAEVVDDDAEVDADGSTGVA